MASKTASKNANNTRAIAADIITSLVQGQGSLTNHLSQQRERDDYSFLQELCFGTCRHYYLLLGVFNILVKKPFKAKDLDLQNLVLVGLYQLRELATADHAAVNETVSAVKALGKPWARGLVNGILRNYQRRAEAITAELPDSARHAHPAWLAAKLQAQWPDDADRLLAHGNARPPMTLRINTASTTRAAVQAQLLADGHRTQPGQWASSALYLDAPSAVAALPGFSSGEFSVQDEASQLVPTLLQLAPGQRVLDACAAPGGKTCHLLESEQSLSSLVAVDESAERLGRIQENLDRLRLKATLKAADARNLDAWWDGTAVDRILLDAPCSATGVIRRHPDIKLLRREADIPRLAALQQELLIALWPCLASGGLLLYTTCSLLRDENEATVAAFLAATPNAKYERITADWGVECPYGRQLLTGSDTEPDGFYFALLRKE